MAVNTLEAKAHELLRHLGPSKLAAVVQLLEVMVHEDDGEEELTEEDRRALRASDEYCKPSPISASPWSRSAGLPQKSNERTGQKIHFEPEVPAQLRAIPQPIAMTILEAIHRYAETGAGPVKPLSGEFEGFLRLRMGNHRVFCKETADAVTIHRVRDRRQAYR